MHHPYPFGSVLVLALTSFFTGSCLTAPLVNFSIDIPEAVSPVQVEVAIISAIAGRNSASPLPSTVDPVNPISATDVEKMFGTTHPSSSVGSVSWTLESRAPREIHVGIARTHHYLRLAIEWNRETIRARVISSERLRQTNRRIHRNANRWILSLMERIASNLRTANRETG